MAKIQLGALVTNIAGSVGGTTFRRGATTTQVYNKQTKFSSRNNFTNSQKFKLGKVFKMWSNLNSDDKLAFTALAVNYPVIDKFGNTKYLTGRQLFNKLNTQLVVVNSSITTTTGVIVSVPTVIVTNGYISQQDDEFIISFGADITVDYICFSLVPLYNFNSAVYYKRKKVDFFMSIDNLNEINIFAGYKKYFKNFKNGQRFVLQYYTMNRFGFKSALNFYLVELD